MDLEKAALASAATIRIPVQRAQTTLASRSPLYSWGQVRDMAVTSIITCSISTQGDPRSRWVPVVWLTLRQGLPGHLGARRNRGFSQLLERSSQYKPLHPGTIYSVPWDQIQAAQHLKCIWPLESLRPNLGYCRSTLKGDNSVSHVPVKKKSLVVGSKSMFCCRASPLA